MGQCQSQCNSLRENQISQEEVSSFGKQQTIPKKGSTSDSFEEKDTKRMCKTYQSNQNETHSSTQQQTTQTSSNVKQNGQSNSSPQKNQNQSPHKKEQSYEGISETVQQNGQNSNLNANLSNVGTSVMKGQEILWRSVKYRAFINIFYGTTKGTSNELANQMAETCESQGFYVRVLHLEKFEPNMLKNCNLVIFFLSSYGIQGGPTDDAQQFYLWLNNFDNQGKPLKNLEYSIFGLYNTKAKKQTIVSQVHNDTEMESNNNIESHTNFNNKKEDIEDVGSNLMNSTRLVQAMNKKQMKFKSMGKRIDIILNEVGAKKFYPLIQVDSSKTEMLQESFKSYSEGLLNQLKQKYQITEKPEDVAYNLALQYSLNIYVCQADKYPRGANNRKELEQIFNVKLIHSKANYILKDELYDYFLSSDCPIQKIQYLVCDGMKDTITVHSYKQQSKGSLIAHAPRSHGINLKLLNQQHQYLLIDIDVSNLPSLPGKPKFETGGILHLYPQNDDASVKNICEFLGLNENALISLSCKDSSLTPASTLVSDFKYPIPFPITIKQYLKEYLDIHGQIDCNQVYELAKFAAEQVDRDTLINLCKFSERDRFDREINELEQHSILSLILNYNIKVPFHILFGLGKLIKPRQFMISSSFLQNPNVIQLTVRIHIKNHHKNDEVTENYQQSSKRIPKAVDGQEDEISVNNAKSTRNTSISKPSTILNSGWEGKAFGLTAQYLLDLYQDYQKQKQQEIRIKCVPNHFQLPLNDINVRVILICIDEGIALFRSYLQEIEQVNNCHNHEIYLYYGTRLLSNNEYLYQNELQEFQKKGVIKKLEVALTTSNVMNDSKINKSDQNNTTSPNINDPNSFMQFSCKNNSSSIQLLLENQVDHFSQLIENIDQRDSNIRIYISGSQLMSQGIIGAIAKSYSQNTKKNQYESFSSVLNFENDGRIVRIIWES